MLDSNSPAHSAAALAAGVTRDWGAKEFEIEATVIVKVWAYDAADAAKQAWSPIDWDDYFVVATNPPLATGKVDA